MIQSGLRDSLVKIYDDYRGRGGSLVLSKSAREQIQTSENGAVVPQYSVQSLVRPLFGKGEPQRPTIGDHPDFLHLDGSPQQEYCAISTIENSTRMGVVFGPEEAYRRKNAIICMAIEIIKTFDGHVHRIMGDAVMAYFGGKAESPHSAAIDALNCAAFLRYFFGKVVLPQLNADDSDDSFGIRIGVDYGPKEKVLWASYGYAGMSEVTATSFYVDVAAKLQGQAGRNKILLGQSIREFIDFPEELAKVPTRSREGVREPDPYISPNYTGPDGRKINYRKFLLDWESYLKRSHVAVADAPTFYPDDAQSLPFVVTAGLCRGENLPAYAPYAACSGPISKGTWLRFEVIATSQVLSPERVRFSVENHGIEAGKQLNRGNHTSEWRPISRPAPNPMAVHYETTAYRGFHDLIVEVGYGNDKVLTRQFGVYVE